MTCYYCLKGSTGLLLDKRLKPTLPQHQVYNLDPCDECSNMMSQGIILIGARDEDLSEENYNRQKQKHEDSIDRATLGRTFHTADRIRRNSPPFMFNPYRTGEFLVVTDDFISRNIQPESLVQQILNRRFTFVPSTFAQQLLKEHEELNKV